MTTTNKRPVIQSHHLEAICSTIAATEGGLTGSEIGKLLADMHIADTHPTLNKRQRLYNAFAGFQNQHQCSNNVLDFLKAAMQPARYIGKEELYQTRLSDLNKALSFIATEVTPRGTLRRVDAATTLTEAQLRASHFRQKLEVRKVHEEIFKYCGPELLVENYFHSVFEGVKSVADRLRIRTGLYVDGHELADTALSTKGQYIRINLLQNDTDRNEQTGLCFLIKGLFSMIRNPTAHTPKLKFVIEEEEALDIMTTISLVHKKLDKAL